MADRKTPRQSHALIPTHAAVLGNQRLYRLGLCRLLDSLARTTVVDDQPLTLSALKLALKTHPNLVVIDLGGGSTHDNLKLIANMARSTGDVPLLLVTGETCSGCLAALTRLNVHSIVSIWADRNELLEAIASARSAKPHISADLVEPIRIGDGRLSDPVDRLSSRQKQILGFIARGTGVSAIAEQLGISTKTVETHRARIKKVLGIGSTNALRVYAIKALAEYKATSTREV